MQARRRIFGSATALAIAVATLAASPVSAAAKGCGPRGYAYAGLQGSGGVYGVSATLDAAARPVVQGGHVAAWVGVGAPGEGPRGSNEWLQIGLNTIAGNDSKLYYEIAEPWGTRCLDERPVLAEEVVALEWGRLVPHRGRRQRHGADSDVRLARPPAQRQAADA